MEAPSLGMGSEIIHIVVGVFLIFVGLFSFTFFHPRNIGQMIGKLLMGDFPLMDLIASVIVAILIKNVLFIFGFDFSLDPDLLLSIALFVVTLYIAMKQPPRWMPRAIVSIVSRFFGLLSRLNPLMRKYRAQNFIEAIDNQFSRDPSPWLRGDQIEAARTYLPEEKFPFLYRVIPADIRRPVLWDGRTPDGAPATWLTYNRLTDDVVLRATEAAEALATKRAAACFVFVLFCGLNSVFHTSLIGNFPSPPYSGIPTWAGFYGVLDWAWVYVWAVLSRLPAAIATIAIGVVIAPLMIFALAQRVFMLIDMSGFFEDWKQSASNDLKMPTRDAMVLHSSRWPERENELKIYARQVEDATTRLAGDPLIPIGTATGTFRARGDNESPVAGQTVALDFESIRQSMMVVGGSGTGKTRLVLRPLARSILNTASPTRKIGMIVIDGKGVLHRDIISEIEGRDDVITVGTEEGEGFIDLVGGMSPADVSSVFEGVSSQIIKEDSGFWGASASLLVQHAASIAYAADLYLKEEATAILDVQPWSLAGIYTIAQMPAAGEVGRSIADLIARIDSVKLRSEQSLDYQSAAAWVLDSWIPLADQTRSGIKAHLDSVLGRFFGSELGQKFGRGDQPGAVSIEHALRGGILLVAIGTASHGAAGQFAAVWLKTMLFMRARQMLQTERESRKSTVCVVLADEYHMLATKGGADSDATMWNIARECGLCLVAATQSVIAMQCAIGDDAAKNLLQQCRSKIFLSTDESSTIEYATFVAGKVHRGMVYHDRTHNYQETAATRELSTKRRFWSPPRWVRGYKFTFGGIPLNSVSAIGDYLSGGKPEEQFTVISSQIAAANRSQDQSQAAMLATQLIDKLTTEDLQLAHGYAFALIQRAGVDRSDIIDLTTR